MAEIGLDRAGVAAGVGQGVARGVAEHMGVDLEWYPALASGALDQKVEAGAVERAAALRDKDVGRFWLLCALQSPQRPQLLTIELLRGRDPVLLARDVDRRGAEVDVVPAQVATSEARSPCR
jgi:hypothetical protein